MPLLNTRPFYKVERYIATYFEVSVDYLLGVENQNNVLTKSADSIIEASSTSLSEQEKELLTIFKSTSEEGRLRIIQTVMNIYDEIEKKPTTSVKNVVS